MTNCFVPLKPFIVSHSMTWKKLGYSVVKRSHAMTNCFVPLKPLTVSNMMTGDR